MEANGIAIESSRIVSVVAISTERTNIVSMLESPLVEASLRWAVDFNVDALLLEVALDFLYCVYSKASQATFQVIT